MKAQVITKEEYQLKKHEILSKIDDGAIFIHPTDTIYGIGCDASNDSSVKRIREIKQRDERAQRSGKEFKKINS